MAAPVPVFAYGSNLHRADLARWMAAHGHGAPGIVAVHPAVLEGFRLAWDLPSPTRGGGAADVRPAAGEAVHGAVLLVDAATFAALDEKEGRPRVYDRRRLPVRLAGGETLDAWVYEVTDASRQAPPVWPGTHYLGLLHGGSRDLGLPAAHRAALRALPSLVPGAGATLRPGRLDDAPALGRLHVATWREAYRGLLPDAFLDGLDPLDREAMHRQALRQGPEAGRETLVVEAAGGLTGFALAGPARDRDLPPGTHEVYAVYLRQASWGTGVGRALFDRARWPGGEAGAVVWVLEANARARRFYAAAGFAPDGARKAEAVGGAPQVHLRYRRPGPGPDHPVPGRAPGV